MSTATPETPVNTETPTPVSTGTPVSSQLHEGIGDEHWWRC